MFKTYTYNVFLVLTLLMISSCTKDDGYIGVEPDPISPVVFNVDSLPYNNLSEYNFFEGAMSDLSPVYGVLPYDLNSALFSDYAKKKRFVWMPKDSSAKYINDYSSLKFPTGTILIKNFYYENVLPEMHDKWFNECGRSHWINQEVELYSKAKGRKEPEKLICNT